MISFICPFKKTIIEIREAAEKDNVRQMMSIILRFIDSKIFIRTPKIIIITVSNNKKSRYLKGLGNELFHLIKSFTAT